MLVMYRDHAAVHRHREHLLPAVQCVDPLATAARMWPGLPNDRLLRRSCQRLSIQSFVLRESDCAAVSPPNARSQIKNIQARLLDTNVAAFDERTSHPCQSNVAIQGRNSQAKLKASLLASDRLKPVPPGDRGV